MEHYLGYETVCLFSLFVEAIQSEFDNVIAMNSQSCKVLRHREAYNAYHRIILFEFWQFYNSHQKLKISFVQIYL